MGYSGDGSNTNTKVSDHGHPLGTSVGIPCAGSYTDAVRVKNNTPAEGVRNCIRRVVVDIHLSYFSDSLGLCQKLHPHLSQTVWD